jgi:hypothetical protein
MRQQTRLNDTSILLGSCTVIIRYMTEGENLVLQGGAETMKRFKFSAMPRYV